MFAKHTYHFTLPKICVGETKSACTGLPFQSVSTHHFSLSKCMASHLTSSSSGTTSAQGAAWIFKVQHSSCHSLHLWQVLSSQQTGKRQKMTARFVILGFYILPLLAMCPRSQRRFKACHAPSATKSMRTHRILLQQFFGLSTRSQWKSLDPSK